MAEKLQLRKNAIVQCAVAFLPRSCLRDEPRLGGGCARIHVATAVEVIVDLRGAADHSAIEEYRECRRLEITFPERSALVVLPQQRKQERRYHGVDIDAEHIRRRADVVKRLDQLPVKVVKDVIVAAYSPR